MQAQAGLLLLQSAPASSTQKNEHGRHIRARSRKEESSISDSGRDFPCCRVHR